MNLSNFSVAFEGCDGVGKSTHVNLLKNYLLSINHSVSTSREPGGPESAEKIREIVLDRSNNFSSLSELLLINAARRENIISCIKPTLASNSSIIIDRFILSTLVYQGHLGNLKEEDVLNYHKLCCENFIPDVTFFLYKDNIQYKDLKDRLTDNDYDHYMSMKDVQDIYWLSAKKFQSLFNIIFINASQDLHKVNRDIINHINEKFNI